MPDDMVHPTPQVLTDFGLGKLPEAVAAVVSIHLDSCPACRQAVAAVPPDSFLGKVRAAGPAGSSFPPGLAQSESAPISVGRPATPTDAGPDLPPELAQHPRYRIQRELGRGGMGVVYQARHKEMDRPVVIKIINRALLDRPDALERFRREIRAAAQLSHPNIVTAYDAEQAGELHMLVMEFVPGHNLAEVLHRKGPLPISFACYFARQVALGLQHAHERDLVHRDIKPQNLMLTPTGQVKILDFGLAKVFREESTSSGLTADNAYMGTPDYCAPEQAKDARTADIRADLYSLGCTLYYLLAGRPPFREDTPFKTLLAHLQKAPQPLPELRPEVPAELWQVVKRLLAKGPAQRYQTPTEVAQALIPFINPGAKQEAKRDTALPSNVASPAKETVIEVDRQPHVTLDWHLAPPAIHRASAIPSSVPATSPKEIPGSLQAKMSDLEHSAPFGTSETTVGKKGQDQGWSEEQEPLRPRMGPGTKAAIFLLILLVAVMMLAGILVLIREVAVQETTVKKSAVSEPAAKEAATFPRTEKPAEKPPGEKEDGKNAKQKDRPYRIPAFPPDIPIRAQEKSNAPPGDANPPSVPDEKKAEALKTTGAKLPEALTQQREKRMLRWTMKFITPDSRNYVLQLRGLGAILAVPIREEGKTREYRIIRNLSARPIRLLKEDISKIQRIYWVDDSPQSVNGVMTILGLSLRPSHFVAFMPERLEQQLFRLEMAYLKKNHPGRTENDILETKFQINRTGKGYEPVVIYLKPK